LRKSGTVHSIKDLEKALPSIASISGMLVKDYVQAMSDENQIKVEKIGSGNWYWSFASDELKVKENELDRLRAEKERLSVVVESMREKMSEGSMDDEEREIQVGLKREWDGVKTRNMTLERELESYRDGDPTEIVRKGKETKALMTKAGVWTDDILTLEGYVKEIIGGDEDALEGFRKEYYGKDHIAGEGLKEWT